MKKMIVAVAFLVLGVVVGVIVLLGSEEKVVPQAKVAKVTITCELGRSEFDVDCDGIADTADSDPTVANPDQGVAECQTWRDCESGFACRRGQCEEARIVLTCDVGHNGFDVDCDGIGDSVDNCPDTPNPDQANCDELFDDDIWLTGVKFGDACDPDRDSTHRVEVTFRPAYQP